VSTEQYFLPKSVSEAVQLLQEHGPTLMVMAGGTVAMPLINEGVSFPKQVMGLRKAGLEYIHRDNGGIALGCCTSMSQVLDWGGIPALKEAAHSVGGWAIRNMGTVGGNLFAPPPAGDFAVMLLALDAQLKLVSAGGERLLPLADFYTGFMTTALESGEILTEIQVPIPRGKTAFEKFGRKQANTPSVVTVGAHVVFDGEIVRDARLAMGNVGPYPIRRIAAEQALVGAPLDETAITKAADIAIEECDPLSDSLASEWYRRTMAPRIVRRVLTHCTLLRVLE